jgi:hypothetical protein
VLRPRPVELPVEDLAERRAQERQSAVDRASAEAAETPLDPTDGTPMALRLLRTGENTWVLLLVLHHSACDGWSVSLLLKELAALYGAAVRDEPGTLPPVRCQPVESPAGSWSRPTRPPTGGSWSSGCASSTECRSPSTCPWTGPGRRARADTAAP